MFVFAKPFRDHVKLRPSEIAIDNLVFKLHYRITFWLLLACSVLVSSRQFIQEHIQCIGDPSVRRVINTFCFFSSTFTIARYHNDSYLPGVHVVSPGVGPMQPGDEKTYHAYYQWVPFVLFGQAILVYLPHYIWKHLEKGRIRAIVTHVRTSPLTSEEDKVIQGYKIDSHETRKKREKFLKSAYLTWTRVKLNRDWARNFVFCETLNFLNVFLQIKIVDDFLRGNFMSLGPKWIDNDEEVLERVFPKLTKCTFHKYGQSGSIQTHDTLCVMSLNIINEKVYVLLWFWFLILAAASFVGLVWRVLSYLLHSRSGGFNRLVWSEISPGPMLKSADIEMLATKLSFSDWLFLYYIGKNMDPRMFRSMVSDLSLSLGRSLLTLRESDRSNIASESSC